MSINTNDLIQMYKSGKSVAKISNITGIPVSSIYGKFNIAGFKATRNGLGNIKTAVPDSEIIRLYNSGMSENQVAIHFGVSRNVIRNRLIKHNVHIRTQSEAETVKWSQMTDEQRANQVKSANEKVRTLPKKFFKEISRKQAITKQKTKSKLGAFEQLFIDELKGRGFKPIPQKAVDVYNLDIAVGNTAIEIHVNSGHPHNHIMYRKRIMKLLELNWNVIYIKITKDVFIDVATDDICRFIDTAQSDESRICQYRVIRGTGEFIASGRLNGNELSIVTTLD